jgi:hypothetical protein
MLNIVNELFFLVIQYDRYGDPCLHGCVGSNTMPKPLVTHYKVRIEIQLHFSTYYTCI